MSPQHKVTMPGLASRVHAIAAEFADQIYKLDTDEGPIFFAPPEMRERIAEAVRSCPVRVDCLRQVQP